MSLHLLVSRPPIAVCSTPAFKGHNAGYADPKQSAREAAPENSTHFSPQPSPRKPTYPPSPPIYFPIHIMDIDERIESVRKIKGNFGRTAWLLQFTRVGRVHDSYAEEKVAMGTVTMWSQPESSPATLDTWTYSNPFSKKRR